MVDQIVPFNSREIFLSEYVNKSISIIKETFNNEDSYFENISDISNLINIKTYLHDDKILKYVEDELKRKKYEILKIINLNVSSWFKKNFNDILNKNPYWIELALWREVNQLTKILEKINGNEYLDSLLRKDTHLSICLQYKNVVKKFSDEILEYLKKNAEEGIGFILKKYEIIDDDFLKTRIYLPSNLNPNNELGLKNIYFLVEKYINETQKKDYNRIDNLRLLSISKSLNLNNRQKFEAKKKYDQIKRAFFEEYQGNSFVYSVRSTLNIEFKEFDGSENTILFSEKWVRNHSDFKTRFIYNISYFLELIERGRMMLDPLIGHGSFLDIFTIKGKDEFPINNLTSIFQTQILSLILYQKMLSVYNETIESLLARFYNEYIVEEFGYDSFNFEYDDIDISYKSKAILILPIFESILRKIEYFLINKRLDFDYIDFDNEQLDYRTIKSAQEIKNVYLNPEIKDYPIIYLHYPANNLYIDGESISVYEAVRQKKVIYSNLRTHDKGKINQFIHINCLKLNENDEIEFVDNARPEIYKHLYFDGEIIYHVFNEESRRLIDEDLHSGLLISDDNFLSKRESDMFSYIMDVKLYSNSLNLRNRYSHKGSVNYNDSEAENEFNYYTILMLFLQVTLKINLELCIIADS